MIALLLVLFISTPASYLHTHDEHLETRSQEEPTDCLAFTPAHHHDSCELCDLDLLSLFDDSHPFFLGDDHSWRDHLPVAGIERCFIAIIATASPRAPPCMFMI